jgi:hypothetical protein
VKGACSGIGNLQLWAAVRNAGASAMVLNPPQHPARHTVKRPGPRLRWNNRNLLLLIPLLVLLTPLYNRIEPRLFGMPFFYWFQFALLLASILLVTLFVGLTRDDDGSER